MKEKLLRKQFLHTSTFIFQSEMSPQFSCHLGAASATISKKKETERWQQTLPRVCSDHPRYILSFRFALQLHSPLKANSFYVYFCACFICFCFFSERRSQIKPPNLVIFINYCYFSVCFSTFNVSLFTYIRFLEIRLLNAPLCFDFDELNIVPTLDRQVEKFKFHNITTK